MNSINNNYYDQPTKNDDYNVNNKFINNFDRLKLLIPYRVIDKLNYLDFRENNIKDFNTLETKNERLSIPKNLLRNFLGINGIDIDFKSGHVVLDITGKINASEGNLGLINSANIYNTLKNVNDTGLIEFNINAAIELANVLYCDVTKDIYVESPKQSIKALKLFLDKSSSKYKILKYKTGILIKTPANSTKDSICFYSKYDEIEKSKNERYIQIIGEGLEASKNILRVERHLGRFKSIKRAFGISSKDIPLMSVLGSNMPAIFNRLDEVGLKEEELTDEDSR